MWGDSKFESSFFDENVGFGYFFLNIYLNFYISVFVFYFAQRPSSIKKILLKR